MPDSTHGVPHKGNGGLVAMGVIMLLLAGGLIVWKLQSKKPEPEIIEEPAKVAEKEAPAPILDNAPPPPPSEEEMEEEEEKEEEKKPAATGPKGPSGCGQCAGTASAGLQAALGRQAATARSCYNTALRRNPNLQGKMSVAVKVSPSGSACSASVASSTMGDPAVSACVVSKFRAAKYPAPAGGCADLIVPLNFTKKK